MAQGVDTMVSWGSGLIREAASKARAELKSYVRAEFVVYLENYLSNEKLSLA